MRLLGQVKGEARVTCDDFHWCGSKISKGEIVFLMHASANTDPDIFGRVLDGIIHGDRKWRHGMILYDGNSAGANPTTVRLFIMERGCLELNIHLVDMAGLEIRSRNDQDEANT